MKIIDTNVILRILLEDDKKQAEAASEFLERVCKGKEKAFLSNSVLLEIMWVLENKGVPRERVKEVINKILKCSGLITESPKDVIIEALDIYSQNKKLDWTDSLLLATARINNFKVVTFDKDILKFKKYAEKP